MYWAKSWQEVVKDFGSDPNKGLSKDSALERLKNYGENKIIKERRISALKLFLDQFKDPLVIILIAAAVVSALFGEAADTTLIVVILFFNAVLGFLQEYKAEKALEALQKMSTPRARVLRDGKVIEIPSTAVVPGDIVLLEEGDVVPADIRLIDAIDLYVDESLLTGESYPVHKSTEPLPHDTPLAERRNMVFMNTYVVRGHGKGVVVATGMRTEVGKIAKAVGESVEKKTHLEIELERFGGFLAKVVLAIAVLVFILFLIRNPTIEGALSALLVSVSLAVAAVPEGLPAVVTITLALGVRRMAKRNALVRRLKSVETLGSVDVICTDKTGTLTKNKMEVAEVWGDEEKIAEIGYFCNNADPKTLEGDPTEVAIMRFSLKHGKFHGNRVKEIPFSSARKMMSVVVERDGKLFMYTKGAPEVVVELCKNVDREHVLQKAEEMASKGLRVLAMAYKECENISCPENDLIFVGLVGLLDPPREEVPDAVRKAQEAGIRVVMVTGDHAATAREIARRVGIPVGKVVTGKELDAMSDKELEDIIEDVTIFARVSPEHKPRIVDALKRKGHIVAMTGDGVNDAVALKRADIGIAMGSGTDVAKEAADMVLLDDSFATIVAAVEEGRRIFDNIKKFVLYLLRANVGEVLAVTLGALMGWVILRPAHLLWVNLLTDGPPATAIAVDPPEPDVMRRKPRKRDEGLLTQKDKKSLVIMGVLLAMGILTLFALNKEDPVLAQSVTLTGFVIIEMLFIGVVRKQPIWTNKYLLLSVIGVILLQLAAVYTPLSNVLGTVPITFTDWMEILGVSALIYFLAHICT